MKTKSKSKSIDLTEFETKSIIQSNSNTLSVDERPISSANATTNIILTHSTHTPFTPIKKFHTPINSSSYSLKPKATLTPEAIPRKKQILPGASNPINLNPTTIFSSPTSSSYLSSSSRTFNDHLQSDQNINHSIQQNVLVSIRLRSFDESFNKSIWNINETNAQIWQSNSSGPTNHSTFDAVFGPNSSNEQVYKSSGTKDLINSSMIGYDSTIFAYGQTASGKTFTLNGDRFNPGLIQLSIIDIFKFIRSHPERDFLLRASYLEIYNEQINDLLIPLNDSKPMIKIRLDPLTKQFFPNPIREEVVTTEPQVKELLNRGNLNRHISGTDFNSRSSRSHTILSIVIESKPIDETHHSVIRKSKVSLIDLAGSERATSDSNRRTEGAFINKSLLTLEKVIGALSSDNLSTFKHIPFRDSKLTQILQPALNGTSKVCVICTINPTMNYDSIGLPGNGLEESKSTLRFAKRVKKVKVKAVLGEILSEKALITRYRKQIVDLQNQLELAIQASSSSSSIIPNLERTVKPEIESNQERLEEREEILERLEKLQSIVLNAKNLDEFCLKKRRESGWIRSVSPIKVGNRDEEGNDDEDDELEEVYEEDQLDYEKINSCIEPKKPRSDENQMKEIDLIELNELRLIISNSLNSSNEIEIDESKIKERYELKLGELLNENLERKRFGEEMVKLLEDSQSKVKKLELFIINELKKSLKKNKLKKKIRRSSIGTYHFTNQSNLNHINQQQEEEENEDSLLNLMNEIPEIRSLRASFDQIEIGNLD